MKLVAAVSFVSLVGCESGAKREAASLVAAVERFETTAADAKGGAAAMVRAAAATNAEVVDAKGDCVKGVDATVTALDLKTAVETKLEQLETHAASPDDPDVRALPAKLDESEALLKEGRAAMRLCDDKLAQLRRKYDL